MSCFGSHEDGRPVSLVFGLSQKDGSRRGQKDLSFHFHPTSYRNRLPKPFLSSPDGNVQPVFLGGKRTDIFFMILAEGIMSSIEIDQDLSPWHRFEIKVASMRIGLLF